MPLGWCAAFLIAFLEGGTTALNSAHATGGGIWPVGFIHLIAADSSRPLQSRRPRPLDIGVWYPSRGRGAASLTYRDYFLLTPTPPDSSPSPDALRRELDEFESFLASRGASPAAVRKWLDAPMLADAGAPASAQRFPLVLIAQGNAQTIHDQAPLAEYLVSRGYVVATVPSPMRIGGPLTDEGEVGARAEEQALDLAFVLARVANRPDVAGERVGIVAHSFGARGALLLSMRDSRISALVSLDGGIGTATGRTILEALPSYRADSVRAPILHFYERLDPFMAPEFGLLRSLTSSDRWLVAVPAMHHHHFTSLGAVAADYPALRPAIAATAATARSYRAVTRATGDFLDAFLKDDSAARSRFRGGNTWPPLGTPERLSRYLGPPS